VADFEIMKKTKIQLSKEKGGVGYLAFKEVFEMHQGTSRPP